MKTKTEKHTAGPLEVIREVTGDGMAWFRVRPKAWDAGEIATFHFGNQSTQTAEANAVLFAAAPDLLEALKDVAARFPKSEYEGYASKNARKVIAKAEGK